VSDRGNHAIRVFHRVLREGQDGPQLIFEGPPPSARPLRSARF
jgi:hypothetical protein